MLPVTIGQAVVSPDSLVPTTMKNWLVNPSSAEAIFVQSTRTLRFLMLVHVIFRG